MKRISQIAILLLCASAAAFGHTALATVTGTVKDPTGAVLANAPVPVKNVETGQVSQLPVGTYNPSVTSPGFKSYKHNNFSLSTGQAGREDVALQVGQPGPSASVSESLTSVIKSTPGFRSLSVRSYRATVQK